MRSRSKKGETHMKRTKKPSQCDIILKFMKTHKKGITGKQAYKAAHSMNLAQRIYDLKKRGHKIIDCYVEETNDYGETYRVKQYRLVK